MTSKIDIGRVITNAFDIYKDQAGVLLGAAFAIYLVVGIAAGLLVVGLGIVGALIAIVIGVIADTLYRGMVVELVNDVRDGTRDSEVGDLFKAVTGVVGTLILAGILAGLGIALGFILLIVPGLILLTIWAVIAPVIVLERVGVGAAFGRSRQLVKDNGWQVFGVIVIVFIITQVVVRILSAIGGAGGDVGTIIGSVLGSTITAPIAALTASVLYFSLRELKGEVAPGAGGQAPGVPVPGAPPAAPPLAPPSSDQPIAPPTTERPAVPPRDPGGPQSPA